MNDHSWEFVNGTDIEIKYWAIWVPKFDIPESIVDAVRFLNVADLLRSIFKIFQIEKLIPGSYFCNSGLNVTGKSGARCTC
jgi:hypothetical protein